MSFYGKEYKLDKQENFEKFLDTLGQGFTAEGKAAWLNNKSTLKVVKNGDSYTQVSSRPDNTFSEVTFKDGVEFEETVRPGITSKTSFKVNGNTITQVQKFQDGTQFTFKKEFSDNGLVETFTRSGWDGEARRYYK